MQFIAKDMDPMVSSGEQGTHQNLLFNKMMQGKVVDEHYASMVKYGDKLERQLADVTKRITEAGKSLRGLFVSRESKAAAQQEVRLLDNRRTAISNELRLTYQKIRTYEQTKMTWDLNSALQPNYTESPAFTGDNISSGPADDQRPTATTGARAGTNTTSAFNGENTAANRRS